MWQLQAEKPKVNPGDRGRWYGMNDPAVPHLPIPQAHRSRGNTGLSTRC